MEMKTSTEKCSKKEVLWNKVAWKTVTKFMKETYFIYVGPRKLCMLAFTFCILINSNIFLKAVLVNYCQLSGNRFWDTIIQQCFANPFLSNSEALEKILVFANRSHGLSIKPRGGGVGGHELIVHASISCRNIRLNVAMFMEYPIQDV